MKIAHIVPPWIAIPPENYGGTEVVLYNLVEEQVVQGHDVTLFQVMQKHRHGSFRFSRTHSLAMACLARTSQGVLSSPSSRRIYQKP